MAGRMDRKDPLHNLPVAERFVSINGEGPRAGMPAAFVRLTGCNLSCAWCDTQWACTNKCDFTWMDPWQITQWVSKTRVHAVTITGGEPLIHPIVGELLRMLVNGRGSKDVPFELPEDLTVEVETNGSISLGKFQTLLQFLPKSQSERVSFTMDYKLPSSGMEDQMEKSNFLLLSPRDCVKFVIGSDEDLDRMLEVGKELRLWGRVPVFVSPVFGVMDPARIAKYLMDNELHQARLQLQLHKILWPGVERDV